MSATNPTFGEIRFQCQKRLPGVDPDVLDSLINERYRRVLRRGDWQRLRVQAWLQTVAPYATGTLAVTQGSTALTGTDTVWTAPMTGRSIHIAGRNEFYTFTRTGDTTGTLERAYEGEDETEATYSIWKSVYALPAGLSVLHSMRALESPADLDQVSQEQLDEMDPDRSAQGTPARYAHYTDDASTPPCPQVELHPVPDAAMGIPYWYTQDPTLFAASGTSGFLAPWLNPDVIYAGVKADVRSLEKDYTGERLAEEMFNTHLIEMFGAEARRLGPQRIKMAPQYTRHNRARWQRGAQ
jgi:uncharacterized protein YbdZ (MbtH family)